MSVTKVRNRSERSGYFMCTTCLKLKQTIHFAYTVYLRVLHIDLKKLLILLMSINWLVVVTEVESYL